MQNLRIRLNRRPQTNLLMDNHHLSFKLLVSSGVRGLKSGFSALQVSWIAVVYSVLPCCIARLMRSGLFLRQLKFWCSYSPAIAQDNPLAGYIPVAQVPAIRTARREHNLSRN